MILAQTNQNHQNFNLLHFSGIFDKSKLLGCACTLSYATEYVNMGLIYILYALNINFGYDAIHFQSLLHCVIITVQHQEHSFHPDIYLQRWEASTLLIALLPLFIYLLLTNSQ